MALAIFDLDNTLLNGDSDHAWGEFVLSQGLVDPDHHRRENDRFYADYCAGELDIDAYVAFAMQPLLALSQTELEQLHQRFMVEKVAPMRQQKADALLAQHREAGDYLLIITATNRFITDPIATSLGVDDLMATDPEIVDGHYTGRIVGTPCFQAGKVVRLKQWLQQHPEHQLAGCVFYSDSHNDLPLLELVDQPIVVDPDDTLREQALQRDWPVISLRD